MATKRSHDNRNVTAKGPVVRHLPDKDIHLAADSQESICTMDAVAGYKTVYANGHQDMGDVAYSEVRDQPVS